VRNKHIFVILMCLALSSVLALRIDTYRQACASEQPTSDVPVFMRFLGEGRSLVSSLSILQADRYFHGGVGHFSGEGCAVTERENITGEEHEGHEGHEDHVLYSRNILFRISQEIAATEHIHLHGDQIKEIIPWLYYAAEIDSQNIQAYTLTGYYLCDRLDKVDQAIDFLQEGLKKNPDSWEINAELGRIYFQHIKNHETAVQYLSNARELLQNVSYDKFQERYVLSFLAMSYEALEQNHDALPLYERLNNLFPNSVFEKKINKNQ